MVLERIIPDQKLPIVKNWWWRVLFLNSVQLGIVILGALTWEQFFQSRSLFKLSTHLIPYQAGLVCYLIVVVVFYWWHRLRHQSYLLWNTCHQIHHSPARIETITSFYKHPFEIFCNSLIISVISFSILGLSVKAASMVTLYTGIVEYFYHMNIKTPHWVGFFIQRPEMHRLHHQRGVHHSNFADLPILDMIFNTYKNPKTYQGHCGFKINREAKLKSMLLFKNVNNEK